MGDNDGSECQCQRDDDGCQNGAYPMNGYEEENIPCQEISWLRFPFYDVLLLTMYRIFDIFIS